jgi:signal transduction histidine kinase
MFSKSRTDAASPKAAQKAGQKTGPTSAKNSSSSKPAGADKASRAEKRAEKRATKAGEKAASQVSGKVGTADRLAAARAAAAAVTDEITSSRASRRAEKQAAKDSDAPVYAPGEEPSFWNLSEWSLRRKVALVLAVPVTLAAVFGGLRVNAERQLANNYAASASQVTVLGPAIAYLAAAEHAAVVARAEGIDNPKLDAAQKEVVDAGTKLVEARDQADLTPTQLRQVNDVISLSEQMRNGMAYVSLTSSVSQVRQLERGVTQIISTIIDEQTRPDPGLLVLAQALDGRLSVALQEIQVSNSKTIPANPVELYTEFGVELASIDRLAISLGQTDPRVLEIRQGNAQRVVNARGGNTKMVGQTYDAYDTLIDDVLTDVENGLATSTRNAQVLTWADSIIIGLSLLAAIILALLVSRLLVGPIRRVRAGALEVAHERLPEAVAKIRAGEDPGEIEPIAVTTHEETGQLARAVDDLHRQAVKLASGEAHLRAQVGDMFVTLSRRNTSLINQQLGLIETLESDEEDPQRLESLFRLDHLASRMRRNAESLVILSGAPTRATEQDDLSLTDVLQAAIAGVQDYRRVQLDAAPAQRVSGEASADVVHLLSELVDNALSYSPPSSKVMVTSSFTRGGVIVQVTDGGLGIAEDALSELNEKLRAGGEVTPDTARRMGLFVVSRLALRHGLTVQLDHNDRMGITATVFLPTSVLSDTARLEAGSGGAQVIELGATQAVDSDDYDEYAGYTGYGESDERVDADVVAYRRPEPEPEQAPDYDPITAAINAYGLPQRRPGASGAGHDTAPASMGGGFFDRVVSEETVPQVEVAVEDDVVDAVVVETDVVEEVDAPEEEVGAAIALGPVSEGEPTDEDADEDVETDELEEVEPAEAEVVAESDDAPVAELDEDAEVAEVAEVAEDAEDAEVEEHPEQVAEAETDDQDEVAEEVAEEPADEDHLAPVLATLALAPSVPFDAQEATAGLTNGNGNGHASGNGNGHAGGLAARLHGLAAAARNTNGDRPVEKAPEQEHVLGGAATPAATPAAGNGMARTPASMDEDETPIFRSLRSNWLSTDSGERPWANSEVDAGWDAADRVEATPPTRRTETGLPMRRPGNRLIPGGLSTPAPVQTVRDPEAIRARLAAHAAGVSRGRNAASVPDTTTQEADPA